MTEISPGCLSPKGLRWVLKPRLLVGPGMDGEHCPVLDGLAWLHLGHKSVTIPKCEVTCVVRRIDDGAPAPEDILNEAIWLYAMYRTLLVTCDAGLSRSVAVCYGLLVAVEGYSHEEAVRAASLGARLGVDPILYPDAVTSPRREPLASIRLKAVAFSD